MKKEVIRKVLMVCLLVANICCLAGVGIVTVQAGEAGYFYYKLVQQEKSMWCWAASAENSVRWEMDPSRDQKSAVKKIKGSLLNPYPNVGGTIAEIEEAAEYISKGKESYKRTSLSKTDGVKSFAFLKNQIQSSDVTILISGYYSNGKRNGGHACVCVGFSEHDDGSKYLCIYDPWDGTRSEVLYTKFKNGYQSRMYDGTVWNAE